MPRRVTRSQLRSIIRQAENKQRRAIEDYNRRVRQHNARVKREIDSYNRKVQEYNSKRRRVINTLNRDIREYNNRVRADQTRLQSARATFSRRQTTIGQYNLVHRSAAELSTAYDLLDSSNADPYLSDLAERETTNSLVVVNNLLEVPQSESSLSDVMDGTRVTTELSSISNDLNSRWIGALYALNPHNPEATRHFCTSSREIIASVLNARAPDAEVLANDPNCHLTPNGTPSRRAKIRYCLQRLDAVNDNLENFIDVNVKDLNTLFTELNAGSHGPSGKFTSQQLAAIKTRVEEAIIFVSKLTP